MMKKYILNIAILFTSIGCSKTVDSTKNFIEPQSKNTQWEESKRYYVGLNILPQPNILTIYDDSTYYYNPVNLLNPAIDSVGSLKIKNGQFSFISNNKKDTTTFIYTIKNDTLHLKEPNIYIEQHVEMIYTRVH